MTQSHDVIVIGAGPGGYVAAIRCAQLGLRTACIDAGTRDDGKPALGGTCLNVGCIPSKALLESSEQFHRLTHQFAAHGIEADNPRIDVAKMLARKDRIVRNLTDGVGMLMKSNRIEHLHGQGRLLAPGRVGFTPAEGGDARELQAPNIILAAGSVPVELDVARVDGERIVDSTGALEFAEVPGRLAVIGAGVIGLELGSVWRRLGSEVVLLEALETFLPAVDRAIARDVQRQFARQKLDIRLGARVTGTEPGDASVTVHYTDDKGEQSLEVDRLIVAVGRRPNTGDLLGSDSGVRLDDRGFIEVDDQCRTGAEGVWAVGDCVRGPMLAHKASEEGVAVAERIAGGHGHVDFNTVPWVIYTAPEIAWVGLTEEAAREREIPVRTGSFPFAVNGRAKAMEEPVGQVKMVAHAETDRILGVHIVGPYASELIAEAVLAMEFGASSEDIARTVHGHPTLSEVMHEAALAVDGRAIHRA